MGDQVDLSEVVVVSQASPGTEGLDKCPTSFLRLRNVVLTCSSPPSTICFPSSVAAAWH